VTPGIFVFGGQNAAALNADGSLVCAEGSVLGASCRPARPGDPIAIYTTGLGADVDPPLPDGVVIQGSHALRGSVDVTIDGRHCTVPYKGLVGAM
jgi:uncharacterized protein (TIGR03437 family)